jgi:hypothetical protein
VGFHASASPGPSGGLEVTVGARGLLYGVRVSAAGHEPSEDAFNVEPGGSATVVLSPSGTATRPATIEVSALNVLGPVEVPLR